MNRFIHQFKYTSIYINFCKSIKSLTSALLYTIKYTSIFTQTQTLSPTAKEPHCGCFGISWNHVLGSTPPRPLFTHYVSSAAPIFQKDRTKYIAPLYLRTCFRTSTSWHFNCVREKREMSCLFLTKLAISMSYSHQYSTTPLRHFLFLTFFLFDLCDLTLQLHFFI